MNTRSWFLSFLSSIGFTSSGYFFQGPELAPGPGEFAGKVAVDVSLGLLEVLDLLLELGDLRRGAGAEGVEVNSASNGKDQDQAEGQYGCDERLLELVQGVFHFTLRIFVCSLMDSIQAAGQVTMIRTGIRRIR